MIKAEVVFNGDDIVVNGHNVSGWADHDLNVDYCVDGKFEYKDLEQAIAYCLQQPPK